jgi:aryl-alcohol dehydrogenase-like predicted oxidoreductase
MLPRFKPENFDQNLKLVETAWQIAKRKGVTMAQVAIGWVSPRRHPHPWLHQGGTHHRELQACVAHQRRHGRDLENPRHPAYFWGALWQPA